MDCETYTGETTNVKEKALREEIISLGEKLHALRLVAATGGNLSARMDDKTILITATAVSLGELRWPRAAVATTTSMPSVFGWPVAA